MNSEMQNTIEKVCEQQSRKHMPIISYAGHDAQILSQTIPCAMIFVPSQDGISHNPKEFTQWTDIEAGANVMLHTILEIIGD